MSVFYVEQASLKPLLRAILGDRKTYGVQTVEGHARLVPTAPEQVEVPVARGVDPLKSLFFRPRQDVGRCFDDAAEVPSEPSAVVGATACDLAALNVLDEVFLGGDFVDPYYQARRDDTLLVSVDCTEPLEVCFCTFSGGRPHPQEGFDLNLSPIEDAWLIEVGSEGGATLLKEQGGGLTEATQEQLRMRDSRRAAVEKKVAGMVSEAGLDGPDAARARINEDGEDPLWNRLAEQCVECGACNFVCPTCHCFLLVDLQESQGFRRFRNWDACLYEAFALEASGANPRARRAERLHGRLEKKFDFIKANFDVWGCVGCGRCIEACAGQLDIRETLRDLVNA
jgi:ferredoxin